MAEDNTPTNVVDDVVELYHSRSKGVDKPRDFHAGTYQAAIDRSAFMFGNTNMYQLIKNTQELAQEQVNDMLSEIVSDSTGKFEDGKYLEREILVDLPNGNQQPVNVLVETIDDTGGYKVIILDKDNFGFTIYSEDGFGESPANKSLLEVNGNAVLVGEADDTFGYVAGFKPENKTFNYKDGYELYKVEIKPNANVVTFTSNIELVENGVKQNIDPDLFVNYLEMNLLTDIDSITLPDGKTIDLQGLSDTEKRNKLKNNIDVIGYRNQMEDVGSTSYYFLNNDAYTETLVDNATNNKFDNDVLKKFIDTNPNVGITDFKRASDERLNIVTDLLSSKPDTPTNVVDDVITKQVLIDAIDEAFDEIKGLKLAGELGNATHGLFTRELLNVLEAKGYDLDNPENIKRLDNWALNSGFSDVNSFADLIIADVKEPTLVQSAYPGNFFDNDLNIIKTAQSTDTIFSESITKDVIKNEILNDRSSLDKNTIEYIKKNTDTPGGSLGAAKLNDPLVFDSWVDNLGRTTTSFVDNLPLETVVKNRVKNLVAKKTAQAATPGGIIDAVDAWELSVLGLMAAAVAFKEYDEIPTIITNKAVDMFNSMTSFYGIPPVQKKEYDLDYEFITKVLDTGEKYMPTDIIVKKGVEEFKEGQEAGVDISAGLGAQAGVFGNSVTTPSKTDTMETTQKIQPGVQEEKMFKKAKPQKGSGAGSGVKIL